MKIAELAARWDEAGFVVVPRLLEADRVTQLRDICDRVWTQWLAESPDPQAAANYTNMAFLTEPRYFTAHPEQLTALLGFIADPKVLALLALCGCTEPLFHNTQYFFEPRSASRAGDWHRDQQFGALDLATEQARMQQHVGVHLHVALAADAHLEIVPGTHRRWDTAAELAIRKGWDGQQPDSSAMLNATRVALQPGDAVLFSAWSLHRGHYVAGHVRRTFDVIYGTHSQHPPWYTPPPTCFLRPCVLNDLAPHARQFFERFIETYRESWLAGEYDR